MPRYAPTHKRQTRTKVLAAAGRALREEGLSGATIPGIMARAGLTQGAFYAHFENKDALVAEASAEALASASQRMLDRGRAAPPGFGFAAVVRQYLSQEHRDNLAGGCPLPALSGEVARGPACVRHAYTEALSDLFAGLADLVPESVDKDLTDAELAVASAMVGGVLLSRAVDDADLSERILAAARTLCLRTLGGDAE